MESNMEVTDNAMPESMQGFLKTIYDLLSSHGWTILFLVVVFNLVWSHFYPKYKKWKDKQEDRKVEDEFQQNPELILERQTALALSRQRLQEEHDRLAKEYEQKIFEKEEKKRQEKISKFERLQGKLGNGNTTESPNLRENKYNPLMGSGPSCSYRPSRRGPTGGG